MKTIGDRTKTTGKLGEARAEGGQGKVANNGSLIVHDVELDENPRPL